VTTSNLLPTDLDTALNMWLEFAPRPIHFLLSYDLRGLNDPCGVYALESCGYANYANDTNFVAWLISMKRSAPTLNYLTGAPTPLTSSLLALIVHSYVYICKPQPHTLRPKETKTPPLSLARICHYTFTEADSLVY
jgi:hypothetical protein